MGSGSPWFEEQVVGKGTLEHMVRTMCSKAGIGGSKTNHSNKATGATTGCTPLSVPASASHTTGPSCKGVLLISVLTLETGLCRFAYF